MEIDNDSPPSTLHLWSPMLADRDRQDEGTNARGNMLGEKIAIKWEEN